MLAVCEFAEAGFTAPREKHEARALLIVDRDGLLKVDSSGSEVAPENALEVHRPEAALRHLLTRLEGEDQDAVVWGEPLQECGYFGTHLPFLSLVALEQAFHRIAAARMRQ